MLKLQLDDVALFVRVARLGSFSAAARERHTPVSQVTRALARLESACGARLMHRSTHGLSLTDEGDSFLAQALRLLDIEAELAADLAGRLAGPSGWVRVSVSAVLAQAIIAPSLPSLHARHPGLKIDLCADDRIVDMAREGIDLAIRTGVPRSDTVVARQIGVLTRSLYAAPAYAARHGLPQSMAELPQHHLISNSAAPALNEWAYQVPGRREGAVFQARGSTRVDNTAALVALVQCGVGISRIVDRVAQPLVASGSLVPVLAGQFRSEPLPMLAVMLQERHRLPKVRACVEHWAGWMAGP